MRETVLSPPPAAGTGPPDAGLTRSAWLEPVAQDARAAVLVAAVDRTEHGTARQHELRTLVTDASFPTGREEVAP